MLSGLGHRAVSGGYDKDGSVHLGGACYHVLDVVGMSRAVDVGVMAFVCLVFDVGDGDGDAAFLLFGGVIDGVVGTVGQS